VSVRLGRRLGPALLGLAAFAGDAGWALASPMRPPMRPVELPPPELVLTVAPIRLALTRPTFTPPAVPPLAAAPVPPPGPPLPRFQTLAPKPLPPGPEPGPLSCALAALGRAASLLECGIQRLLGGDARGAREPLEEARDRGESALSATASLWLGELALREGRYDLAAREYRAALGRTPPAEVAAHAALGAGWTALARGDLAEAQRALGQALGLAPPSPVPVLARFLGGVAALLAGRPADALAAWDVVAGAGPPPAVAEELLFWRGVAAGRAGQWDAARGNLDRFLAVASPTHPLRADALAQAGWSALARRAADDAVRRFLEVPVAVRPDLRPQVHAGLARAYLALGDAIRARDEAQRMMDLVRETLVSGTLLLVADAALARGADPEAERLYGQLRGALPADRVEYVTYRLGEIYERHGRIAEAQRQYLTLRETGRIEAIAQRAAYRLGLLALRAQRAADARTEAETLLRAGVIPDPPDFREAVLLLAAEGAGRGEDPNRAVALFRLALRDYPSSPHAGAARLLLGWALFKDGEPESAIREWQEAALAPALEVAAQANLAIAEVALQQGREAQALDALRAFARLGVAHPLQDVLALNRGILLVRSAETGTPDEMTARLGEAVSVVEPLAPRLARSSHEPPLRRALGLARYRLGQYDLAERQFRQAAQWAPADPSNWLGVGLAALNQARHAEAEDALGRARLAASPQVAAPAAYALVLVALTRRDDGAFRERATFFVDRYPGDPRTGLILYALVRQALARPDLEQADVWVKRLLRDHPKSDYVPDALFGLAGAARDRPTLAREAYRELVARLGDPRVRAEARLGLAEASMALGAVAEAQQAAEGFLAESAPGDPRAPRAWALLIRTLENQGQRDRVIAATAKFLAQFPNDPLAPAIRLTRGHLLLAGKEWDQARQALEAARDTGEPAVASAAQVWLGELHRVRDEHEAAIAAYLGATYLYPETPWAARGLQGAAQSYVARQMPRQAAILLRKLADWPGVDADLQRWARQALAQLGSVTGDDPAESLRKGAARPEGAGAAGRTGPPGAPPAAR
jgi:tetratricopeptide (TPR) repeat protein